MFRALLLVLLLLPSMAFAGDAARGKVVASVRCLPCHHIDTLSRSIGPGLLGVYGRAPSISGVPFDVWDAAALDAWIASPRSVKPNTRMALPPIADRDRADIIAYFKSQTDAVGPVKGVVDK
ncbi:c-type cytochrome [Mariprofundus erugo]|uniref:C-type cytochrome n=1 Tax=Mariprofundus erugo TaxID=2528639 RepID=A0A5R9GJR6_9PROT|nr:c-type cytochrome [Mariprofundus erugo]TLS66450.1 c-type cytochrome [Mariprofundus erugo]